MRNNELLALLAVFLIALLAAFPFLNNPGLPSMNDAELHIMRIAEMGYSLQQGICYPRWAPDFFHGYGYPIFNYYAPLTYHLGYYASLGQPENAAQAAKFLFVVSIFIGAYGAYYLAKYYTSQGGGLIGSAAFCFAPYIVLINPHIRGDLAEVVSISFLPWVMYFWEKLWNHPKVIHALCAVCFSSATFLSHNLTGLTMSGILLAWAFWHMLTKQKSWFRTSWILLSALVLVMVNSFFWLPFLVERPYIMLQVAGDGHYDFRNHFVPLTDLFRMMKRFDYRDTLMNAPFSTGLLQSVLATIGGISSLRVLERWVDKKKQVVLTSKNFSLRFYTLAAALLLYLITPLSQPFWEIIPGLAFYQFPWRFLGPLAVLMIPLIAKSSDWLSTLFPHTLFGNPVIKSILIGCLITFALPMLYPLPWTSGFPKITRLTLIEAELKGRWRGTTSTNDFVPTTVEMLPGPTQSVIDSYKQPPIDRVNRITLPKGTNVTVLHDHPNHFQISSEKTFVLRLYLFYFPGWRAYIDGVETDIDIAHPEGFITLEIPAGNHDVLVRFENTPIRTLAWWIGLLGLVIGVGGYKLLIELTEKRELAYTHSNRDMTDNSVLPMMVIVALIGAANWFIIKPGEFMHFDSRNENIPIPAKQIQYREFGNQIALLGYDLSVNNLIPGKSFSIQLYWQATIPVTNTYQSFVHVMLPNGQILTQSDHLNPGGYPTNLWPQDRYVRDNHTLEIPVGAEPGEYPIYVGIYSLESEVRLATKEENTGTIYSYAELDDKVVIRRRIK